MQVMPRLGLDEQELRAIVESACKDPPKGLSKPMREITQKITSPLSNSEQDINHQLWEWGAQIEALFDDFPIMKDICKVFKHNQYPARHHTNPILVFRPAYSNTNTIRLKHSV